jgi:hypothetical protein
LIAIATDNTAAIAEYTDDSTVFPVGSAVFERKFQYAQKVLDNIYRNLKFDVLLVF